jgi:ABC-type nitrate/sulfonate/bicarbonate transport system substrate-binding protein
MLMPPILSPMMSAMFSGSTHKQTHSAHFARITAGVLLFALVVLLILAMRGTFPFWRAGPLESLRVGAFVGDVGALAWIAQDHGFYEQMGLSVDLKGYNTGSESVHALRAGQVDLATASEFVVAASSFAEPDLRVLASVCQYWNKGLIGRRDHGLNQPIDLKGKRIGVTATSTAEHTLVVFLALQGLTLKDVQTVPLAPPELVERITDGTIDAVMTWQPHVEKIEHQLGNNAVSLMETGSDAYLLLLTRPDVLSGKATAIEKYLRALLMAEDWVRANPELARQYLLTRFALNPAYVDKLWPKLRLVVNLPQEILEIMDGEARWLAKRKGQAAIPDFALTVQRAPLSAVKPVAVTLFGLN